MMVKSCADASGLCQLSSKNFEGDKDLPMEYYFNLDAGEQRPSILILRGSARPEAEDELKNTFWTKVYKTGHIASCLL